MSEPIVLVGTYPDGLFAITNPGAHPHRTQELQGQPLIGLTPDGAGGALAIVGGHSLQRRAPDGQWSLLAASELPLACCLAVRNTIYVGTDTARLLRLTANDHALQPLPGFGQVPDRYLWFAGSAVVNGQRLGPPLGVRSLAANAGGTVLLANVHVGGIPRSTDGGTTWHPTLPVSSDVHEVRAHPTHPQLVAAASAVGLWLSHDAGATWTPDRNGLHAPYCSAVAFAGPDVLVAASDDHFAPHGKIYRRSTRPDGTLASIVSSHPHSLPEWLDGIADTGCIATRGPNVALVDRGGTLYWSSDFGQTWSRLPLALPSPSSLLIC